jgi:hypothetical protein
MGAALLAFPTLGHAAAEIIDYKPGVVKSALAEGKTVLVDYFASW